MDLHDDPVYAIGSPKWDDYPRHEIDKRREAGFLRDRTTNSARLHGLVGRCRVRRRLCRLPCPRKCGVKTSLVWWCGTIPDLVDLTHVPSDDEM
jgi:hypothetical protein